MSGQGAVVCKPRATHRALIMCNMCDTWHEGTAQLLSLNRIYFSFILLDEGGGGNRNTRRKPPTTSFRKCHILKPKNSNPNRDSNSYSSIGGRLGKQTCYHDTTRRRMLYRMSGRCAACHFQTTVPRPLERTCWREFVAQWGDC